MWLNKEKDVCAVLSVSPVLCRLTSRFMIDVYKRQGGALSGDRYRVVDQPGHAAGGAAEAEAVRHNGGQFAIGRFGHDVQTRSPVSYTHLDVYKRQSHFEPVRLQSP